MTWGQRILFCAWCSISLAGRIPLHAQAVSGTIIGAVQDPSGAAVPQVAIAISGAGVKRAVVTDADGEFVAPLLPPGIYDIVAEKPGFKKALLPAQQLGVDQKLRVEVLLQIGDVSESVEVTAAPRLVQSDSSELGGTVGERQIKELPLNGRDFVHLTRLLPGVLRGIPGANVDGTGSIAWRMSASLAANGQRMRDNNFLLDGIDNNEMFVNSAVVFPSVDAIEELKVETGTYAAEFGRALGAVVNIRIKSGGNAFHGSAFEFFRNDKLDANDWFNNRFSRPRPPLRQNQFGATFGGPIRRNRAFFFTDYQGWRRREGLTYLSNVPTPSMKAGDFSALSRPLYDPLGQTPFVDNRIPAARFDPAAKNVLEQLYPDPNVAGSRASNGQVINNFLYNPALKRQDDQFDTKLDLEISPANRAFLRYSFQRTERFLPATLPHGDDGVTFGAGQGLIRAQSVTLNDTHVLSPRWINEFRAGFSRFANKVNPIDFGTNLSEKVGIPGINITSFASTISRIEFQPEDIRGLGPSANQPLYAFMPTLQVFDSLTWARSRHTVKAGFSYTNRRLNILNVDNPVGQFIFQPTLTSNCAGASAGCVLNAATGFSVASFLLGYPTQISRQLISGTTGEHRPELGAYVQDDFRVSSRLTLNLGLRWDLFVPFVEDYDRQSNFEMATGRFVVASPQDRKLQETPMTDFGPRFGFAYSALPDGRLIVRGGYGIFWNNPLTATSGMKMTNPPFLFSTNLTTTLQPALRLSAGLPAPRLPDPNREPEGSTRSILQQNFRDGYAQQWNLNIQRQWGRDFLVELGYVGSRGVHLMMKGDINQAPPIVGVTNADVNRPYIALAPKLRQLSQAQSRNSSIYHSLQAKVARQMSRNLMFLGAYTFGKVIDIVSDTEDLPLSSHDLGMERGLARFDVAHTWTTSWTWSLPGAGKLRGGWELNGIFLARSGLPFTVTQTQSLLSTGTANRPDRLADGSIDNPTPDRWFDLAAFHPTADNTGTYGNAGRNILRGPGVAQVDLSLVKNTALSERLRWQFKLEAFNLLNRAQFGQPGSTIGSGSAGVISSLLFNTPMRQMQLVMKLSF